MSVTTRTKQPLHHDGIIMRVYIVGVSCVGKSTIGMLLAEKVWL
jgi:adenylylsulfate kinase-like enzyme